MSRPASSEAVGRGELSVLVVTDAARLLEIQNTTGLRRPRIQSWLGHQTPSACLSLHLFFKFFILFSFI